MMAVVFSELQEDYFLTSIGTNVFSDTDGEAVSEVVSEDIECKSSGWVALVLICLCYQMLRLLLIFRLGWKWVDLSHSQSLWSIV